MKAQIFADFDEALTANIELETDKMVEIVIDYEIPHFLTPVPDGTIRFFATIQPEGHYNHLIKAHPEAWTYLLTNFHDLLRLPNSHFVNTVTAFVKPDPDIKKKFGVSTVISGRRGLPGHELRHELYRRRNEIKIPFDIYLGYRTKWNEADYTNALTLTPDKGEKIRAFDCMFHIAIDSYQRPDCFSEKLVDCLITKTVPIYWGCTNIEEYFRPEGIYLMNNLDEIIAYINHEWTINEDRYYSMKNYIDQNYLLALQYVNYGEQLQRKCQEVLNENA